MRSSATRARRRPPIRRSRKNEPGHPLKHEFTRAIRPVAVHDLPHAPAERVREQLLRLHDVGLRVRRAVHVAGEAALPDRDEDARRSSTAIPRARRSRGKWGDPEFLKHVSELNPKLKDTQFADYHGHGWNFRAVFKRDRKGNLLDADGKRRQRRRSGEVQEGRAPVVDPRRRRHALRRLPLRAGRARQRPHLRRSRRRGRDRLQGLPRHRATAIRRCAPPGPAALARRHRPDAAAHAGRPPALRVASAASSTSARRSIPTSSGR